MEREIKFRAWDKFNGCYWYSDKYKNLAEFFTAMQHLIDGGNELILERFTGLKDRNGKEIYEGDYIDLYNPETNGAYGSGFVKYHNGGFQINDMVFQDIYNELLDCEVIGNIHENPELL